MISLLDQGLYTLFVLLAFALVISLTFHEFGHALIAKRFGDDTAEKAGRLTLNPVAHIDIVGFLMVVFVGFGYAKPVPTNPRNYSRPSAEIWVAAAGPLMNLTLAMVTWNLYLLMAGLEVAFFKSEATLMFFLILARVNLLLMVFNLLPVAPLDGHYIAPYLLPESMRETFKRFNTQYGPMLLLALVLSSLFGFPVFSWVLGVGDTLLGLISFF
ncbi:MAG: site-2 protease family protein [Proteobacteria bacterium]|nr:site-2 protease family protein [Pseudomonadota bacterium]